MGSNLSLPLLLTQSFDSADRFLQLVAAVRGKLQRGGTPNTVAAARIVLMVRFCLVVSLRPLCVVLLSGAPHKNSVLVS